MTDTLPDRLDELKGRARGLLSRDKDLLDSAAAALRDYKALTGLDPNEVPEILEGWSYTAPPPADPE